MAVESGLYGNATWVTDVDTGTCTTVDTVPTTGWARVCHLTKWTLNRSVKSSKYLSNMTKGNERTTTGGYMASGTLETLMCMDAAEMALIEPGDRVRLRLYVAPLLGHTVSAKITGVSYDVDLEAGGEIRPVFTWEQDDNDPVWNGALAAAPALPAPA